MLHSFTVSLPFSLAQMPIALYNLLVATMLRHSNEKLMNNRPFFLASHRTVRQNTQFPSPLACNFDKGRRGITSRSVQPNQGTMSQIFLQLVEALTKFGRRQRYPKMMSILKNNKESYRCRSFNKPGLLVECGKKWKIVWKILPNSAGNSAEKSEIVRENAKQCGNFKGRLLSFFWLFQHFFYIEVKSNAF